MEDIWESNYLDAYDQVLLHSDIYLEVLENHVSAMSGCSRVLDSCSGTGNLSFRLLGTGTEIVAMDLSRKALCILQQKCRDFPGNLHVLRMSAERLPLVEESVDGVSSMFAAHFVLDIEAYFREHLRVLRPGGIFILTWRESGENMEKVLVSYEDSLRKRGLLETLGDALAIMREGITTGVVPGVRHKMGVAEMKEFLESLGFRNISFLENPYFGQCRTLVARK